MSIEEKESEKKYDGFLIILGKITKNCVALFLFLLMVYIVKLLLFGR